MKTRTIVWGENVHEQTNAIVAGLFPDGMHNAIRALLAADPSIEVETAILQEAEHGLPQGRLPGGRGL